MSCEENAAPGVAIGPGGVLHADHPIEGDRDARLLECLPAHGVLKGLAGLDAPGGQVPALPVLALMDEEELVSPSDDREGEVPGRNRLPCDRATLTRSGEAVKRRCIGTPRPEMLGSLATGPEEELSMADSVYVAREVIGVSSDSWEAAAKNAIETAAKSVRDLRVGEVTRADLTIEDGKISTYRIRLNISFKYEQG
jgi:dodecin